MVGIVVSIIQGNLFQSWYQYLALLVNSIKIGITSRKCMLSYPFIVYEGGTYIG